MAFVRMILVLFIWQQWLIYELYLNKSAIVYTILCYLMGLLSTISMYKFAMKNLDLIKNLTGYLFWVFSNFLKFVSSFSWLALVSNGNTETGEAGTVSQRAFKKPMNFTNISFLKSSSCVKRSSMMSERTYLKGTVRRIVELNKSTIATSVVIWEGKKKNLRTLNKKRALKSRYEL